MSTSFSPERPNSSLYSSPYVGQEESLDFVYQPITTSKCRDRLHAVNLGFQALGWSILFLALAIFKAIGKLFCQFRNETLAEIFKWPAKALAMSGHFFFTACFLEKGMQNEGYRKIFTELYFN